VAASVSALSTTVSMTSSQVGRIAVFTQDAADDGAVHPVNLDKAPSTRHGKLKSLWPVGAPRIVRSLEFT
jgi:hypothetical protein